MKAATLRAASVDVVVTAVVFAVLGAVGAVLWHHQVRLPTFTRVKGGGEMNPIQMARLVGIDGWFFVIGAVGGLLGGVVLTVARSRRPVLMVLLVLGGAVLASWLMLTVGLHLGPGRTSVALAHASKGTTVPVQLKPQATGVEFAWPVCALVGSLVVILFSRAPADPHRSSPTAPAPSPPLVPTAPSQED